MSDWSLNDELKLRKQKLIDKGYDAYCLFCLPGSEITLASELNNKYDYLLALPILRMAHRSRGGNKYDIQIPLISSYIFVFMLKNKDIFKIQTSRFHYRILSKDADSGKLVGKDLEYANWVLNIDGLIGVSDAIKINGKVKIINGPLKQLEGNIVEYSSRSRNCLIEIQFMSQTIRTWLPFAYIDPKL